MKILNESDWLTLGRIKLIEAVHNATYVCETCLHQRGGWVNAPVAVFYNKDPTDVPEGGSRWFGIVRRWDTGDIMITNAISATLHPIAGVVADNGDVIYSRYRHDYRVSPDTSVFIDGGRDYTKSGPYMDKNRLVEMWIKEDKLVISPYKLGDTHVLS